MNNHIPTISKATAERIKQSYIIFKDSYWSVLKASGPTIREYLQGQITQDMDKLGARQAIHSALLSPQGKALSVVYILSGHHDELILLTPTSHAVETVARLRQFALGHQLRIGLVDSLAVAAVYGTHAADGLKSFGLTEPDTNWLSQSSKAGEDSFAIAMQHSPNAYWVITASTAIDKSNHHQTTTNELEALRIQHGFPQFGMEWDERLHPLNANLVEFDGVDFKKGCYVGQEVTSRMHWRGGIKKKLYRVQLDAKPLELPCPIRSSANIGELKSAAMDDNGICFGIALLPIEAIASDTKLTLENNTNITILEACHA
ncbi:MAG: folate-binding protein [Mariprofundus sp.]|nr:folate-binding protein [Mariprofundus sp.]